MNEKLISVAEATKIVLDTKENWGTEEIPLAKAHGRILGENITADRDFPPFDRVTMDGIAIRYQAIENGQVRFPVESMQAAGEPQRHLIDPGAAIEIMTGAALPIGTDTVIRYEDLIQHGSEVEITVPVKKGVNIHYRGEDQKMGDILLKKGHFLNGPALSVAATVGKSKILVQKLPKTVIISTGDELVDVDQKPLPFQIRRSNSISIADALLSLGIEADTLHLPDDPEIVEDALNQVASNYQLVLLSGGVSKGKKDYIPEKLDKIGVEKAFHRVAQRPGKPFWFGRTANAVWFALPGNPVSSYMCTLRYAIPWIRLSLGIDAIPLWSAELEENFTFNKPLQYFLQVAVNVKDGKLTAIPIPGNGSGDFANLNAATGFLELPSEKNEFFKGEVYPLWPFNHWKL